MKLSLLKLMESAQALDALANLRGLPPEVHVRVILTVRALREPLDAIAIVHGDLARKYGTPDKNVPGKYNLRNVKAFNEELAKAGAEVVELPDRLIPFDAVAGRLSAADVLALGWLVEGVPDDEPKEE